MHSNLVLLYENLPEEAKVFVNSITLYFNPVSDEKINKLARAMEKKYKIGYNLITVTNQFLELSDNIKWENTYLIHPQLALHVIYLLHKDSNLFDEAQLWQTYFEHTYRFTNTESRLLHELKEFLFDYLELQASVVKFHLKEDHQMNYAARIQMYSLQDKKFKHIEQCYGTYDFIEILKQARNERVQNFNKYFDYKSIINKIRVSPVASSVFPVEYNYLYATGYILEGKFEMIKQNLPPENMPGLYAQAVVRMLDGDNTMSLRFFDAAIKIQKKTTKLPYPQMAIYAFLYAVLLVKMKDEGTAATISKLLKNKELKKVGVLYMLLAINSGVTKNSIEKEIAALSAKGLTTLEKLLTVIVAENYQIKIPDSYRSNLPTLQDLLELDFNWLAMEYAFACKENEELIKLESKIDCKSVFDEVRIEMDWERALNALLNQVSETDQVHEIKLFRVAYFLDYDMGEITPVLQQSKDGVTWTKGKVISLQRFAAYETEGMTEQDKKVADCIERDFYYRKQFVLYMHAALKHLGGHPYVFLADNPTIPIEIVETKPELTITQKEGGYQLHINVEEPELSCQIERENNTRIKVMNLTKAQQAYLQLLDQIKFVPNGGKDKLLSLLNKLKNDITIYSDLVDKNSTIKQLQADSRIFVQIIPIGDTLKAELFIKPFTSEAPYCKAGVGAKHVFGQLGDERVQAERNLEAERSNWAIVKNALDQIVMDDEEENDIYIFDDPYNCLEFIETIRSMNEVAVMEWPEGVKYKITGYANSGSLNISLRSRSHWFELEGELKVSEDKILTIGELLKATRNSKGRFIELGDGEFLALTEQLRKQLLDLDAYVQDTKEGLVLDQFTTSFIEDLAMQGINLHADKQYYEFRENLKVQETTEYQVPCNLQAELRDYQAEGFRWMARLDGWGAGACLADDMGLGKTIQTISMLLYKAKSGPSLVVAPASVLPNWIREISNFAPSLNIVNLSPSVDRLEKIRLAQANDVCIVTYGVLVTEEERLTQKEWSMIALDEAHTIKNKETKMSKAAMKLKADFRLILTGTPIQNHLGEIWNLFNFINPGLLGTFDRFKDRFVFPIIEMRDKEQQKRLKKLISPFLLRRTKNAVLDELPPKTEIVKEIQLSEEETAAYELIRREAETKLTEDGALTQIQALAEITRLRMAACNINLVNKGINMSSSKINTFLDIVDELKENNHRALVFSQFTSHLALIRKALEEKGISYLYLDGSTSIPEREKLVRKYQTGDELLFLISLKAGGLGLNLTAADFVIHMDPWWNPAIEDQASDRAYRIGQTRPVTIYRLIAQDTIEEKILRLHATKKDLADSLLEGTDLSHKLTRDELLELLK